MSNLPQRETSFKNDVDQFTEYDQKLREQFFNYWSEPNKSRSKMRWELERTWDIKRRLRTFFDNQQKWNNASKGTNKGKSTGAYELLEEIRASAGSNSGGK